MVVDSQQEQYLLVPVPVPVPVPENDQRQILSGHTSRPSALLSPKFLIMFFLLSLALIGAWMSSFVRGGSHLHGRAKCDSPKEGYQCQPGISHNWGQYSPFFAVPSGISPDVPSNCKVTFAQVLSRHGARDPTASKTLAYAQLVQKIQKTVTVFKGKYAFLKDYTYTLGADQLTAFGEQEMVNSGTAFFNRYKNLAKQFPLFVRASSENRVVVSAQKFDEGYHQARIAATGTDPAPYPYPILVLSESAGSNNTLNHDLCTAFETIPPFSTTGSTAQKTYLATFIGPITARINADLAPLSLTASETISLMDLCPFNTVANPDGAVSPFCGLFTAAEWRQYSYYQTLGKYYGYGPGNALGPTQGVGYVNELIARLTGTSVVDHTSVNQTLDSNPATFPVGAAHPLFADFSHDNDMTAIFGALGLYDAVPPLSNTTLEEPQDAGGYSAAWTVPFAARAYFEKLQCKGEGGESVRVIVNDRVVPLNACGGGKGGRCALEKFTDSLGFARAGGKWNQCFP